MWQTVKRGSCSKNQQTDRMSNQFLVRLNFLFIHDPSALDNKTRLQEYHHLHLKSCCQQVGTALYIANQNVHFEICSKNFIGRRGSEVHRRDIVQNGILLLIGASQICNPFPAEENKERKTFVLFGKFLLFHFRAVRHSLQRKGKIGLKLFSNPWIEHWNLNFS